MLPSRPVEGNAPRPGFCDPDNTIDKVIVSQLLNRVRPALLAHMEDESQELLVSEELMLRLLVSDHEVSSDVADSVRAALKRVRFDALADEHFTVQKALRYDSAGYPLLTPSMLDSLHALSQQEVVSRQAAEHVLATKATADHHEILESMFPFESSVVPGHLLEDFCTKLRRPVRKVRFSGVFAQDVLRSMRSTATSIPYLALIVTFFVMLSNIDLWSRFASFWNASTPEEPWSNFCKGGVVDGVCFFHKRDIEEAVSMEETYQFIRHEVVQDLWKYANSTQGAADVPFEGSWLIGALIFRTSPPIGTKPSPEAPLKSCASLNLSEYVYEPRIGYRFDCQYWDATVIPFSHTLHDALHELEHYNLSVPQFIDASLIVQYAMYAPSTGDVAWVTTALSIPKFGGIVPRVQVHVMDTTMHDIIHMAFWFSLAIWALDAASLALLWHLKVGHWHAVGSFSFRSLMLALISASYVYASQVHLEGLLTAHHVIPGLDKAVNYSLQAEQLFSLWVLLMIMLLVQFIAYLDGFSIITTLMARIVPEIFGLLFVFGFLYVMFVMIAMILFGQTMEEYSSFFNANSSMIQYFLLKFDLERILENYPQSGFAFYFVFRMFLFYLVINFFIVTVIAPIRQVWSEGDLPLAVNNMLEEVNGATLFGRIRAIMIRYGIMFLDLSVGFVPVTLKHWMRCDTYLEDLYDPQSPLGAAAEAASAILCMRDNVHVAPYITERARTLPVTKVAKFDASYHLSLLMIVNETNNNWVRDARTMRLFLTFDEFQTKMERDLRPVEDESERVLPPLTTLTSQRERRSSGSCSRQRGSGHSATQRRTSVSHGSDNSTMRDTALPTQRAAEHTQNELDAAPELMEEDNKIEMVDVHNDEVHFHFTRYLVQQIRDHRFFHDLLYVGFALLNRLVILAMYVTMLHLVNTTPRSVAYFSRNAHSGLRMMPLNQNCDDLNCTSGFTKYWTFDDNRRLDHLRMYVERRLAPSLYRSHGGHEHWVPDLTGGHGAVNWDAYITLEGPIRIRQLRAVSIACRVPAAHHQSEDPAEASARQALMNSFPCGSRSDFATDPMPFDGSHSLLDAQAYTHVDDCPEIDTKIVYGVRYRQVPCQGYTAEIHNESQLHYAVNHWIDGQTRFVGISMLFAHKRGVHSGAEEEAIELQYNVYAEFSEGGSAGQFFIRTSPLSDPDLKHLNDVGMVLMSVDFVFGVLELIVPIVHCVVHRRWASLEQQSFMSFRVVYFIVYAACRSQDHHDHGPSWPRLTTSTMLVFWLTYECLFVCVFPFCQFFIRRVTIVNHFIRLTVVKVTMLIPIFAIILSAFALAGYLLWAGRLQAFSTIHRSILTISQGLLGDFEFAEMYRLNATYSMLYMVLFLITVIIFLLNLLLAIIAGCADESREESQVVAPIEVIAHAIHRRVYFGPIVGVAMMFLLGKSTSDVQRVAAPEKNSESSSLRRGTGERRQVDPLVSDGNADAVPNPLHPSAEGCHDFVEELHVDNEEHAEKFLSTPQTGVEEGAPLRPAQSGSKPTMQLTHQLQNNSAASGQLRKKSVLKGMAEELAAGDGEFSHGWLSWLVAVFFEKDDHRGQREIPRFHIVETARIPTPMECLLPRLGPVLLSEVAHILHLFKLPESMQCSFVAYILSMHQQFAVVHPGLYAEDCEDSTMQEDTR